MVIALLRTTRKQVASLKIDDLLDTRRLKSSLRLLGFLVAPVAAMVLFNPSWVGDTFSMLTRPLDYLPPTETNLAVEPKGLRVVRGAPVTIQAAATGAIPEALELLPGKAINERGELIGAEKLAMESLGAGKFNANIARLEKTLNYRVASAGLTSATYNAEAIDPPEIANVQSMLYPPAYTGTRLGRGSRRQHRRAERLDRASRRRDDERRRQSRDRHG